MRRLFSVITLLAALAATFLTSPRTTHAQDPPALTVEAQVTFAVDLDLSAEIAGRILQMAVREGDLVETGQALVQLDPRRAEQEVARAQQELAIARLQRDNDIDRRYATKTLDVQLQELARSLAANEQYSNSVSQTELRRLELLAEQARLSIEKADQDQQLAAEQETLKSAELRLTELNLAMHQIRSPGPGMVATVYRHPGEAANLGEPLLRVVRLDRLRLEAFLPGEIASPELVGQRIVFRPTIAGRAAAQGESRDASESNGMYEGPVVFVSPELHPVTGQCRVWAEVSNADGRLRPGMRGQLSFGQSQ